MHAFKVISSSGNWSQASTGFGILLRCYRAPRDMALFENATSQKAALARHEGCSRRLNEPLNKAPPSIRSRMLRLLSLTLALGWCRADQARLGSDISLLSPFQRVEGS